MSKQIYEMVTNVVISMLEAGVVPWRQPWRNGGSVNYVTQRPYRGINAFMLQPFGGEFATFKQINEAGGKVKKGAKGQIVVFWKFLREIDKDSGEPTGKQIPMLRFYKVWEINTQCEGLKSRRDVTAIQEHNPIEQAERIVGNMPNKPLVRHQSGKAVYNKLSDIVTVPPLGDYTVPAEYYSTLFHELAHATGHENRLNRSGITQTAVFGDPVYSQEELVAEFASAMLCGVAGIDNDTIANSASYIGGWLRALKDDKTMAIRAAGQAQKAADYILGVSHSEEVEHDDDAAEHNGAA